jgi:hypothetical protein
MDGGHGLYLERDSQPAGAQPGGRKAQRYVFAVPRRIRYWQQGSAGDSSRERFAGIQCDVSQGEIALAQEKIPL